MVCLCLRRCACLRLQSTVCVRPARPACPLTAAVLASSLPQPLSCLPARLPRPAPPCPAYLPTYLQGSLQFEGLTAGSDGGWPVASASARARRACAAAAGSHAPRNAHTCLPLACNQRATGGSRGLTLGPGGLTPGGLVHCAWPRLTSSAAYDACPVTTPPPRRAMPCLPPLHPEPRNSPFFGGHGPLAHACTHGPHPHPHFPAPGPQATPPALASLPSPTPQSPRSQVQSSPPCVPCVVCCPASCSPACACAPL